MSIQVGEVTAGTFLHTNLGKDNGRGWVGSEQTPDALLGQRSHPPPPYSSRGERGLGEKLLLEEEKGPD